jgi:hypothetical protein
LSKLSGPCASLSGSARERPDLRGRLGQERARECRAACGPCLPAAGSGREQGLRHCAARTLWFSENPQA